MSAPVTYSVNDNKSSVSNSQSDIGFDEIDKLIEDYKKNKIQEKK